ncbi:hypothetical protein TRV_04863 [Trichophyton verrucosum HKI 0517]|uniref:Uncharacterized protein n=1 Tax=Trichophyton verrucosum (strain HKI 0517) TaxID=663202 RepID=D4DCK8_TRIVH|nr:uncharacterized protein TRV_04863 [Trichophyton verrucosum HKI 0517]EFE40380.1 hypothetical protein TRV_04863 [Trichophyton verrucosum HKI 0517]
MHTSPPHLVFFFMQRTTLIGRGREGGWEFDFRPSIYDLSLFSLLLRLFFDCARERQVYLSCSSQSSGYYSFAVRLQLSLALSTV